MSGRHVVEFSGRVHKQRWTYTLVTYMYLSSNETYDDFLEQCVVPHCLY